MAEGEITEVEKTIESKDGTKPNAGDEVKDASTEHKSQSEVSGKVTLDISASRPSSLPDRALTQLDEQEHEEAIHRREAVVDSIKLFARGLMENRGDDLQQSVNAWLENSTAVEKMADGALDALGQALPSRQPPVSEPKSDALPEVIRRESPYDRREPPQVTAREPLKSSGKSSRPQRSLGRREFESRQASARIELMGVPPTFDDQLTYFVNTLVPLVVDMERDDYDTSIGRADTVLTTLIRLPVLRADLNWEFYGELLQSVREEVDRLNDRDSYVTVGGIGDMLTASNRYSLVLADRCHNDVLTRIREGLADPSDTEDWQTLLDGTLNNMCANAMRWERSDDAKTVAPSSKNNLTRDAALGHQVAVAAGLHEDMSLDIEIRSEFLKSCLAPQTPSALTLRACAVDRMMMVPSLVRVKSKFGSFLTAILAATARIELGKRDRAGSSFFNAGVELLRWDESKAGQIGRSRSIVNALGLLAAAWASRGEFPACLAVYDGDDCLVNLFGAMAQLGRAQLLTAGAVQNAQEVLDIASQFGRFLDPNDVSKILSSSNELGLSFDANNWFAGQPQTGFAPTIADLVNPLGKLLVAFSPNREDRPTLNIGNATRLQPGDLITVVDYYGEFAAELSLEGLGHDDVETRNAAMQDGCQEVRSEIGEIEKLKDDLLSSLDQLYSNGTLSSELGLLGSVKELAPVIDEVNAFLKHADGSVRSAARYLPSLPVE